MSQKQKFKTKLVCSCHTGRTTKKPGHAVEIPCLQQADFHFCLLPLLVWRHILYIPGWTAFYISTHTHTYTYVYIYIYLYIYFKKTHKIRGLNRLNPSEPLKMLLELVEFSGPLKLEFFQRFRLWCHPQRAYKLDSHTRYIDLTSFAGHLAESNSAYCRVHT